MGGMIFLVDWITSPFVYFPILFVVPVVLCARYHKVSHAYGLAVLLPLGRMMMAEFVDKLHPFVYAAINAVIRVSVLLLLAYLVGRITRQTALLKHRFEGLVRVCAWSRTVEYEGEWLSFEAYMKRRFNLSTTHGISPDEEEKFIKESNQRDSTHNDRPESG